MKHTLVLLLIASSSVFAQTSYTYPGTGWLQEQNGTKIGTKKYTKMSECAADAVVENARRKLANSSLVVSAVECVATTGYVTTWSTPVVVVPPPTVGLGKLPANPVLRPGFSTARVTDTYDFGRPDPGGTGAFRIICDESHYAFDDPIVFPNQPGRSHLHLFFGNVGSNANSTTSTMSTSGNSTCAGGLLNRSSYWIPAIVDTRTNNVVNPTQAIWYYKCGYRGVDCASIKPFPKDLRMIAGDARSTVGVDGGVYKWVCHDNYAQNGSSVQNCTVGDLLELRVFFPQCWDGVNLDSPDHKSHMAYANGSGCPASHPVAFPELSLNIDWKINVGDEYLHWRLSSDTYTGTAGHSAHADFWAAWDATTLQTIVTNCINATKDCHAHLLGNGKTLY